MGLLRLSCWRIFMQVQIVWKRANKEILLTAQLKTHAGECDYMKKRITIVLEVDTDDKQMLSDDFIKNDLEQEINCASNSYEIKSVETEVI